MKKLTLAIAIMLIVACSKEENNDPMVGYDRKVFETAGESVLFTDIACGYTVDGFKWFVGDGMTPVLGDTCYVHATADFVWNSNNLYTRIEGDKVIKTNSSGVIIELEDCN